MQQYSELLPVLVRLVLVHPLQLGVLLGGGLHVRNMAHYGGRAGVRVGVQLEGADEVAV